jgi:hypothetical protein
MPVLTEGSAELKEVKVIKHWLRDAVTVFDRVATAGQQLGQLNNENARAMLKAKELAQEKETLEHDIETLKKLKKSMKDDGTLTSPLKASEWDTLLKDTAQSFGGVREYITRLSDFFGVKSPFRG